MWLKCSCYTQTGLEVSGAWVGAPPYLLNPVWVLIHQASCIRAGYSMDLDTFCPCHKSEYIIAEYRVAASCHAVVDALDVLCIDDKDVVAAFLLDEFFRFLVNFGRGLLWLSSLLMFKNPFFHISNINRSIADSCIEGIYGLELLFLDDCCCGLVIEFHLPVLQTTSKQFLSVSSLGELSFAEFLLNLGLGLVGHNKVEPVR